MGSEKINSNGGAASTREDFPRTCTTRSSPREWVQETTSPQFCAPPLSALFAALPHLSALPLQAAYPLLLPLIPHPSGTAN